MSLDVSPELLAAAESGRVDEAAFVDCIRTSLPYAWETISLLVSAEAARFFSFRTVPLVPRPATRPRPSVVVAATTRPTVEVAAARGLPVLLGLQATVDEHRDVLAHYAKVAADHGHDAAAVDHIAAAVCHIADSRRRARSELRSAMPAWLRAGVGGYVRLSPGSQPDRDPHAYVEHLLSIHPVGTANQCAEHLRASAEATGIRRWLLMVEGSGDTHRTRETVLRLGAEVVPQLDGSAA